MVLLVFFMLIFNFNAHAADQRLCDYFGWNCNGSGSKSGGRNSSQSLPSQSTASNLNPANVRYAKGLGIETLWQPNNPLLFSLASGTGKLGGALITQSYENSFFGNRVIELDDDLLSRHRNNYRYNNNKYNFAGGVKAIDKKWLSLDLGVMGKFNQDTHRLNLGIGSSGRLGIFTFGFSYYNDDVRVDLKDATDPYTGQLYSTVHSGTHYFERFQVETYSVGTRFKSFNFDYGIIKSRYAFYTENTRIYIYSMSWSRNKFQFNGAIRKEYSPQQRYFNDRMLIQRRKDFLYLGTQYTVNKNIIVGLNHNYFLLNEFSFTGTILF